MPAHKDQLFTKAEETEMLKFLVKRLLMRHSNAADVDCWEKFIEQKKQEKQSYNRLARTLRKHFNEQMLPRIDAADISDDDLRLVLNKTRVTIKRENLRKRLRERLHCRIDFTQEGRVLKIHQRKVDPPRERTAAASREEEDMSSASNAFEIDSMIDDDEDEEDSGARLRDAPMSTATGSEAGSEAGSEGDEALHGGAPHFSMGHEDAFSRRSSLPSSISGTTIASLPHIGLDDYPPIVAPSVSMKQQPEEEDGPSQHAPEVTPAEVPMTPSPTTPQIFLLSPAPLHFRDVEELETIDEMLNNIAATDGTDEEKAPLYRLPLRLRMRLVLKRIVPPEHFLDEIPENVKQRIPDVPKHLNWLLSADPQTQPPAPNVTPRRG